MLRKDLVIKGGVLALFLSSFDSVAIINTEKSLAKINKNKSNNELRFAINGRTGNVDAYDFSIAGVKGWKLEDSLTLLTFEKETGKFENERSKNATFFYVKHIGSASKLAPTYFAQIEENEFRGVKLRHLAGVGARYTASEKHTFEVSLFYENVETFGFEEEQNFRVNAMWHVKGKINERVSVSNTLYLQPEVGNIESLQAINQGSVSVELTESITLDLYLNANYSARPYSNTNKTDVRYGSSLVYRF